MPSDFSSSLFRRALGLKGGQGSSFSVWSESVIPPSRTRHHHYIKELLRSKYALFKSLLFWKYKDFNDVRDTGFFKAEIKYLGADGTYKTNSVLLGDKIESNVFNLLTLL